MNGESAKADVPAKVRSDQLRFAVQRGLSLFVEGHFFRAALAGRAVRCLKPHQNEVGFEQRVRIGDLILVEADEAVAFRAGRRPCEVPVAHDHDVVEVEIGDVLIHRLD
ncbi:hypothetical protein [Candidatus Amarolinea aalborgensis]|uniref:hypothetical protein n=1 Tax=Candidatus Amarolinea aalborgensis TaxID=2249329 RepID=UPI003BF9A1A8